MVSWAVFSGRALHLSLDPGRVCTGGEGWKGSPEGDGGEGEASRGILGQVQGLRSSLTGVEAPGWQV